MARQIWIICGLVAVSACTAPQQVTRAQTPFEECQSYGLVPGTVAHDRCVAAPDKGARLLVVDQETYGTF